MITPSNNNKWSEINRKCTNKCLYTYWHSHEQLIRPPSSSLSLSLSHTHIHTNTHMLSLALTYACKHAHLHTLTHTHTSPKGTKTPIHRYPIPVWWQVDPLAKNIDYYAVLHVRTVQSTCYMLCMTAFEFGLFTILFMQTIFQSWRKQLMFTTIRCSLLY